MKYLKTILLLLEHTFLLILNDMKTLRYNTETGAYSIHAGQYKTMDGNYGAIYPPVVQLEVVKTAKPTTTEFQRLTMHYDFQVNEIINPYGINGTATEVWVVEDMTEQEITEIINQRALSAEQEFNSIQTKNLLLAKVEEMDEEHQQAYHTFFPAWKVGEAVELDMKRQHQGLLYRCIQPHTTQLNWQPQDTPALWVRVYDPEVIPDWVQPLGAHDAYMTGDEVMHNEQHWVSEVDNNTWEPGVYGWKLKGSE